MGGISGMRSVAGGPVGETTLRGMVERLRHRGPDGAEVWVDQDVGLAHARLATGGDEHAPQPVHSADGRWVVVLDGGIVDRAGLGAHLDHPPHTRGDAEVVAAGLALEGIAFVERLRGAFAFAAHDRRTGTTHLVRDRLGHRPLYYRNVPGGVAFGSEVKALLAVGTPPQVDHHSLDAYLGGRSVPAPDTLFDGVKKVRPAHRVSVLPGGQLQDACWWVAPESDAEDSWTAGDAIEAVGDGVREAVRAALVADVPVGALLSGDLVSSLVAAQAQELRGEGPLDTFAVDLGGAPDDDPVAAHRVGAVLGTRHHEVRVRPAELESLWDSLTWHRDAPIADLEDVAALGLARAAGEHVGVVLSGDGADELFGGHTRHLSDLLVERSHLLPPRVRTALAVPAQRRRAARFSASERERLIGSAAPVERPTTPALAADHLLERADRMSTAAALELRPALLDDRLVVLGLRLPPSVKLRSGSGQWLLREAARPLLPDEVIAPRRSAPGTPVEQWLRAGLRGSVRDRLLGPDSWVGHTLDRTLVGDLVDHYDRHELGRGEVDRLWTLLALEAWHARFLGATPDLPHPRGPAPLATPRQPG